MDFVPIRISGAGSSFLGGLASSFRVKVWFHAPFISSPWSNAPLRELCPRAPDEDLEGWWTNSIDTPRVSVSALQLPIYEVISRELFSSPENVEFKVSTTIKLIGPYSVSLALSGPKLVKTVWVIYRHGRSNQCIVWDDKTLFFSQANIRLCNPAALPPRDISPGFHRLSKSCVRWLYNMRYE